VIKRTDIFYVLAIPIYFLIAATRHEFSHGIAAVLLGGYITEIQILPMNHPEMGLVFAYINVDGLKPHWDNWVIYAAPYLCDVVLFLLSFLFCILMNHMPRWLWLNCFIIGILSPLINTANNYMRVLTKYIFARQDNDVTILMVYFPAVMVHMLFLGIITVFVVGAWLSARSFCITPQPEFQALTCPDDE